VASVAAAYDAVVIGAGANGLAAAATLARAGVRVLVVEENDAVGGQGRLGEFAPGFRAAPLGHDSGWLPPAVVRGLGLPRLDLAHAGASVTVVLEPGKFLALPRDAARAADAIRPHSADDAAKWPAFTARLRKFAGFLEALYQLPAPDIESSSLRDFAALFGLARKLRGLGAGEMTEFLRTMPMAVRELLDDWFESPSLKAAVAPGGIEDSRQGPRSGGTAFILLHNLVGAPEGSVRGRGWWRAGPDAFTKAAEDAARRGGATIRTSAAVARILVRDDAVAGIALANGDEIETPCVISTADPSRALLGMVDPVWLDPEFLHAVRQIRYRGCTATILYALDALPYFPWLSAADAAAALAGLVTLTPSVDALERAADAAKYGTVSARLHVELTAPTLRWPSLAPAGKHVVAARAQYAPYRLRDGAEWDGARRESLADAVTAAIDAVAPGFASRVLHRVALTPRDLEERYGLTEGAATQGELALDQILFMRPVAGWGRHAMPIRGLYLGGAGTHPGPGVLGGPGWLAARRVLDDRGRNSGRTG